MISHEDKAKQLGMEHGANAAEFDLQYIIGGRVPAALAVTNANAVIKQYDNNGGYLTEAPHPDPETMHDILEVIYSTGFGDLRVDEQKRMWDAYTQAFTDTAQEEIYKRCKEYVDECPHYSN